MDTKDEHGSNGADKNIVVNASDLKHTYHTLVYFGILEFLETFRSDIKSCSQNWSQQICDNLLTTLRNFLFHYKTNGFRLYQQVRWMQS